MKKRIISMIVVLVMSMVLIPVATAAGTTNGGTAIFPDECSYHTYTEYKDDVNKSFSMMGIKYHNGYVLSTESNTSSIKVRYNLNKKYTAFTVDIGHIDNEDGTTAYLQVYLDGRYLEQIELDYAMSTLHYTLNVSGVGELMFDIVETSNEYGRYYYGFANGTVYTAAECINAGISLPAVSKVSDVLNASDSNLPYQNQRYYTAYENDVNNSFSMMGVAHHYGFVIGNDSNLSSNRVWYNLGKNYQLFTVDVGHIDNRYGISVEMQIFLDGEHADTVVLTESMPTTHYSLNVSGVNQLTIDLVEKSSDYGRYYYGFANPKLYTTEELINAGVETIPDVSETEDYVKTNLVVGEYALPYQCRAYGSYANNQIYNGDINSSFKMDGVSYINGFVLVTTGNLYINYAHFNLGGIFDTISMKIGHIDNAEDSPGHVRVKCDGVYVDEFDLSGGMRTINYTLDVKNVNQLTIELVETDSSYARYYYGFADITTTHTHTPIIIPAISSTCTESGKTEGSQCKTCEQILVKPKTTVPKGHKFANYTKISEATCTSDEMTQALCANGCGLKDTKAVSGTARGHLYDNDCDTSCNRCKTSRKITHTYGAYTYNNDATTKKDGTKTRICTICGDKQTVTATGTKLSPPAKPQPTTNPFTDVKKSDFYYTPVLWAVEKGITSGTSNTTFSPNAACTRGQIATFLWRAAGQPAPKTGKNPFADVKKKDYYYQAVLWAVGKGITAGTSSTTFSPNAPCTRGQIATFLWRSAGAINPKTSKNPFADVKKSDYYYKAVLWAVGEGITAGTSKTAFSPNAPCTRGQIATFLYRAYN